jgi:phosphoglycolate phosphatase
MTPRGIIFDLDGTLTDSKPGLLASLRHMHRTLGWEVPSDDELERWLGPPTATILAEAGHPQAVIDRAIAAFRASLDAGALLESRLYDGIAPLLERLHARGVRMGVATHKIQPDAVAVVEHYGLAGRFLGVHGRMPDELGHSKAPVIARAAAAIGLPADALVMVGDRVNDIASAHELGMASIGVAYGYGGRDELAAAGATRIVDSVDELAELLG